MRKDKSAGLEGCTCFKDAVCFVYTCRRLIDLSLIVYTCRRLIDLSLIAGTGRTLDVLRTVDHGELPNNVDLVVQLVRFIAGQPKPAADSGGGAVLVFLPGMSSTNDISQEFFGVLL